MLKWTQLGGCRLENCLDEFAPHSAADTAFRQEAVTAYETAYKPHAEGHKELI